MIGFKKKFLILIIMCSSCASFSYDFLYPINDKNGGGYIDKLGKIKIEQKYNFALRFVGNYAIAQGKNLKYGVIDKIGNTVIDFKYEDLKNLSEDFVIYKEGKNYGFIDIKNNRK